MDLNCCCSSVIWNSYHSTMLASSDYEGTVTLWDVFNGVKSKIFQVEFVLLDKLVISIWFEIDLVKLPPDYIKSPCAGLGFKMLPSPILSLPTNGLDCEVGYSLEIIFNN